MEIIVSLAAVAAIIVVGTIVAAIIIAFRSTRP
jgi:hypothetical protein